MKTNPPLEIEEEAPKGTSTISKAIFNTSKTIIGAGIFSLPRAYQNGGFVTVSILIVAVAALIYYTLTVLLIAGQKAKVNSYHDLVLKCFGRTGGYFYSLFAFLMAFGCMTAYSVILGDTAPIVLRAFIGQASEASLGPVARILTDRRIIILIFSFFVLLPISSFKDISRLGKFSFLALVFIFSIAIMILSAGLHLSLADRGDTSNLFTIFKPSGISTTIGTLSFAYVCHHNTFIIFNSLKSPTLPNFRRVVGSSLSGAALASLFIGISGYSLFNGKITSSNILNMFSDTNLVINIARGLFAIDMLFTYPLELFVARHTILKGVFGERSREVSRGVHFGITLGLVLATTIISVSTCNLGAVLDLTGGLAASVIAYILPSSCFLKLSGKGFSEGGNRVHYLVIAVGIMVMIYTTVMTVVDALESSATVCKFINF